MRRPKTVLRGQVCLHWTRGHSLPCVLYGDPAVTPSTPHIPAHFNVCPSSKFSPFRIFELLCKIRKRLFNRIKKARLGSMPTGLICPRNVNKLVRYLQAQRKILLLCAIGFCLHIGRLGRYIGIVWFKIGSFDMLNLCRFVFRTQVGMYRYTVIRSNESHIGARYS